MAMSGASLVMRHAGNGVVQATFYVVLTQAMKKLIIYGNEKAAFVAATCGQIEESDAACQSE